MAKEKLIKIKNLSKYYGKIKALNDIDLEIDKGEFICLSGPSGAGKSTLVKLLIRQEWPTGGHILVAERNIFHFRPWELPYYRRKVGVVFQDYKLLPQKTVYENIAFALEVCGLPGGQIQLLVPKILRLVNLSHRFPNYPHELSGGEQQRVSIARALIHNPPILIADEPTGNLDADNTEEILDLLRRINNNGTTIILSTHDQNILQKIPGRLVTLKEGRLA